MYTAENYIDFIETKRFDKISRHGMEVIAEGFHKLELELKQLQKAEHTSEYKQSCENCHYKPVSRDHS